jgi:hypothetical protein
MPTMYRQALLAYVSLEVAAIAATLLLPGNPFYAGDGAGSLGTAVVVVVLLTFGLAYRRRLAWTLAMFVALLGAAMLTLLVVADLPTPTAKALLLLAVYSCQVALLVSPGVDAARSGRGRIRATPAA